MLSSSMMDKGYDTSPSPANVSMVIEDSSTQGLISENALWWVRMVVLGVMCQLVAVFGVFSNCINIVVFIKLGVKDPMNVSILGLSISDFCSCFVMIWVNICLFPPFMELDLPFDQGKAHYLFGSWPHITCVKITTAITAFITVERCLCVTFPLKVKDMITTNRVTVITVSFFILNFALTAPVYYVSYHEWVYSPERNRTIYTVVFREDRDEIESVILFFIAVLFPIISFISTIIATVILVYKLKENSKWRQGAIGTPSTPSELSKSSGKQISSRDAKVTKMVVMISALYLISFSPVMVSVCFMIGDTELKEGGTRENMLHVIFYSNFFLETTNAALNIFIYYSMSSNYNSMFKAMFGINTNRQKVSS